MIVKHVYWLMCFWGYLIGENEWNITQHCVTGSVGEATEWNLSDRSQDGDLVSHKAGADCSQDRNTSRRNPHVGVVGLRYIDGQFVSLLIAFLLSFKIVPSSSTSFKEYLFVQLRVNTALILLLPIALTIFCF